MTTTPVVQQHGLLWLVLRIVYFIVFGLWFSGIWAAIAWIFSVTIIGLPVGLWMLNRLPQVSTLQPARQNVVFTESGRAYLNDLRQHNFLLRALYFVLIGWWFSLVWLTLAWLLSASIIGLPIAFWMINRTPGVMTLANT
jgi:uncharacterized membrane protein YccF (DUF307 family)